MARSLNQVILLGNVGNDPESRTFGQRTVVNFSLATTESWKDKQTGEWKEQTQWHRCNAWSPIAENIKKYVKKGSRLLVQGKVKYESWEKDGVTQYSTKIEVRDFTLLDPKTATTESSPTAAAPPAGANADFEKFPEALDQDDDLPY